MNQKKSAHVNINVYLFMFLIIFLFLAFRLFYLQIISGQKYKTQSSSNSVKLETLPTKRGEILDANGNILATSIPIASIVLDTNASEGDQKLTIHNLAELLASLGYDEGKIYTVIEEANKKGIYGDIEIIRVSYNDTQGACIIGKLYERANILPAASLTIIPTRYYPQGTVFGNILGYIGKISKEEYTGNEDKYSLNDMVGKSGLEKSLELFTRQGTTIQGILGKKGVQQVEIDSLGKTVAVKSTETTSVPGDTFQLTINLELQKVLESSMENQIEQSKAINPKAGAGAGIVFNVNTGEILAMASLPSVNPNDFVDGISNTEYTYYFENNRAPIVNKVVNDAYPPGSTFKMITAFAGLHYARVTENTTITCTGKWRDNIKCTGTHGDMNLLNGLKISCNSYFQGISEIAGIDNIDKTAVQFGLGADTGFTDLEGVTKGFLPSPDSKASFEKNYLNGIISQIKEATSQEIVMVNADNTLSSSAKKEKIEILEQDKEVSIAKVQTYYEQNKDWYIHDTNMVSIGQGLNNYNILQMGQYISTIANGGIRYKPTIIKNIISADGSNTYSTSPIILNKVEMTEDEINLVKSGLKLVTTSGTASAVFRNSRISVAGKTGTAETGRVGDDPENNDYHGLFVGYSPVDKPEIAVAVLIEYGKNSSNSAAYIAKDVMEAYYNLKGD